jgi:hypothetical protein
MDPKELAKAFQRILDKYGPTELLEPIEILLYSDGSGHIEGPNRKSEFDTLDEFVTELLIPY